MATTFGVDTASHWDTPHGPGYQVFHTRLGMLIRGSVPVDDMLALITSWSKKLGDDDNLLYLPGVAHAFRASFVLSSTANVDAWIAEAEAEANRLAGEGRPQLAWTLGPHVGRSSATIVAALTLDLDARVRARETAGSGGVPSDPDDFDRCYRVVSEFGWSDRLAEVAAVYPIWKHHAERWHALEALWLEEGHGKERGAQCPKLFKALKKIEKEQQSKKA